MHYLDLDLRRAGHVESIHAGIQSADDDDARLGNLLAVILIVDGDVRAGRPVGDVSDFVCVRPLPFSRDRSRQVSELSLPNRSFIVSVKGNRETKSCAVLLPIKVPV